MAMHIFSFWRYFRPKLFRLLYPIHHGTTVHPQWENTLIVGRKRKSKRRRSEVEGDNRIDLSKPTCKLQPNF